jgi:hypothetical protein
MGIREFADQLVAWTEDQTWGITNVDLDVAQLFPIHPDVGCVAPDAVAAGDGWLVWPARDGFYAWAGGTKMPQKISDDFDQTFYKMAYETHGGSRATIADHKYIFRGAAPDGSTSGADTAYVYDLETQTWSTYNLSNFSSHMFPLTTIHAPLGNNDAGGIKPLWAKIDYGTGAGEYSLFIGELTTQDNGIPYTCQVTMHFQLPPSAMFKPKRILAYYQATDGWGTPFLSSTGTIGSATGAVGTGTPDTGNDYNLIGGTFAGVSSGTSDIKVSFLADTVAGGTINLQRFFGAVIEGEFAKVRRGMV